MRKEHAIRLLSSMDEKGRKRTQDGIANIAWGGEKKCISSIFVPVCLLMEVVGMLKNMRGKG